MQELRLIGPFSQLLTMDHLPVKGPLDDDRLEIITDAGILVKGSILDMGKFKDLLARHYGSIESLEEIEIPAVALPGLIDAHTHICWAGSRAGDYAMRLAGKTYLDIAKAGGGIWHTVTRTREASAAELTDLTIMRAGQMLQRGVTTIEVKSGYGLNPENELKMLESIQQANETAKADLISTCLAAHIKPGDFEGSSFSYLQHMVGDLLPLVKSRKLSHRVDIYVDEGAFTADDARYYLKEAKKIGFDIVVHADQFSRGGVGVAVELEALSADHLEAATDEDIVLIANSNVIPVALPGASLGLGVDFTPARKLLDAGTSLAIASDWNPGSAPMGNLLTAASILGIYEKLTMSETLAAVTCRAAIALGTKDRGILKKDMLGDFITFPCSDYREILYNQGSMLPDAVWKRGKRI
ncbi:MAG: imidazolonepropionase [Bacteroidales bacterium]|nr:imidazolonepropionase [Bacteroidales bacterium]